MAAAASVLRSGSGRVTQSRTAKAFRGCGRRKAVARTDPPSVHTQIAGACRDIRLRPAKRPGCSRSESSRCRQRHSRAGSSGRARAGATHTAASRPGRGAGCPIPPRVGERLGVRILTGCISNPMAGAMGYHNFNAESMADLLHPEPWCTRRGRTDSSSSRRWRLVRYVEDDHRDGDPRPRPHDAARKPPHHSGAPPNSSKSSGFKRCSFASRSPARFKSMDLWGRFRTSRDWWMRLRTAAM
jgi:hypothetical protein